MTGRSVFERALSLCGLIGAEGSLPADLEDLEARAPGLLNGLIAESTMLNRRLTGEAEELQELETLDDTIGLCDLLCAALPYGLGALLTAEEDPSLSSLLDARYQAARRALLADGVPYRHPITEVYG